MIRRLKNQSVVVKKTVLEQLFFRNTTRLKKVYYSHLPGWQKANITKSLIAFQLSCKIFLKQNPEHLVGSAFISLRAKDWYPACQAALATNPYWEKNARLFFETWFYPVEFSKTMPVKGLFTGYYMPQLRGSLTKTEQYTVPIYGLPKELEKHLLSPHVMTKVPFIKKIYTRAEIDQGILNQKAPIIAWIASTIERLFLEIEGGGIIQLPNGKQLHLGYAGENGAPYTSIAAVMIKTGLMTKDTASNGAIKQYLVTHPKQSETILQQNKSFVFFKILKQPQLLGAQGIALTPGYSLAIDRTWIPLGTPLWLATKKPLPKTGINKTFQRLMIAQDTGGAIRGVVRGDIYWGTGKKATYLGEHMKNEGRYWLLLPNHVVFKAIENYTKQKKLWTAMMSHSLQWLTI